MPAAPAQPRLPQIARRSPAAAPSRLPMNPLGPAAAKPSANWDAHHAGVPHRRRSPKLPGFPLRSEASRSSTIVAVAPDPPESKPCSRLLICLQINQQTIAAKVLDRKAALAGGLRPADLPQAGNPIADLTTQAPRLLQSSIRYRHRPRMTGRLRNDRRPQADVLTTPGGGVCERQAGRLGQPRQRALRDNRNPDWRRKPRLQPRAMATCPRSAHRPARHRRNERCTVARGKLPVKPVHPFAAYPPFAIPRSVMSYGIFQRSASMRSTWPAPSKG